VRNALRLLALGLLLAACQDQDLGTSADPLAPSTERAEARKNASGPATAGEVDAAGEARTLVLFRGAPPRGFQDQVEALGGTVEFTHAVGLAAVRGLDADGEAALGRVGGVTAVAADVRYALTGPARGQPRRAETALGRAAGQNPGDALFVSLQWHLGAVGMQAAWDAGRFGSPSTTVAILDTGIDGTHPDLVGRVDLTRSISYVALDDEWAALAFPNRHVTTDLHYHGTHVAATVVSNGFVAAGVARDVRLMAVRVCTAATDPPVCSTIDVLRGILHAVDHGADVINLSLGGGFSKEGAGPLVSIIQRVLTYANRGGAVVVVAAGNAGRDMDHDGNLFSAYCDGAHAVCVSATDEGNVPAFYTNYGRSSVSVAAPGGGLSPVWAACSTTSLWIPVCGTGAYALGAAGTSMAAPHVAGLAALLVDEVGRNPALIRARILQGAVDLGARGTDPYFGKGLIWVPGSLGL
jgi:lantibiotic leader peptide-processing serine protease